MLSITASGAGRVSEWKRAGSYQKGPDLNKAYKVTQSITGLNEKKEKSKNNQENSKEYLWDGEMLL